MRGEPLLSARNINNRPRNQSIQTIHKVHLSIRTPFCWSVPMCLFTSGTAHDPKSGSLLRFNICPQMMHFSLREGMHNQLFFCMFWLFHWHVWLNLLALDCNCIRLNKSKAAFFFLLGGVAGRGAGELFIYNEISRTCNALWKALWVFKYTETFDTLPVQLSLPWKYGSWKMRHLILFLPPGSSQWCFIIKSQYNCTTNSKSTTNLYWINDDGRLTNSCIIIIIIITW